MKKENNLCYIEEYHILANNYQIDIEVIGKGKDKGTDISNMQSIDENSIVTSNENYIKILEKDYKKPENIDRGT